MLKDVLGMYTVQRHALQGGISFDVRYDAFTNVTDFYNDFADTIASDKLIFFMKTDALKLVIAST